MSGSLPAHRDNLAEKIASIGFFMVVVSRGGTFMLTVLARITLLKMKNKKPSVFLSWFSGTPYSGTQQNRSDKTHKPVQPARRS
jgi:hypothetical protein